MVMGRFSLACLGLLFSSVYSFAHPPVIQADDDFGVRRVKTLNFQWEDIKTGPDGNVVFKDDKVVHLERRFDLDRLHEDFSQKMGRMKDGGVGKSKNVAIGGFSLIIKNGKEFHAIYKPFFEVDTKTNSGFAREAVPFLAFVSSWIAREYPEKGAGYKVVQAGSKRTADTVYDPDSLYERFKERLGYGDRFVHKVDENKYEVVFESPLSHDKMQEFNQHWLDHQRDVGREVQEKLAKQFLEAEQEEEKLPLGRQRLNDIAGVLGSAEKGVASGVGSFVDSEQYLLDHMGVFGVSEYGKLVRSYSISQEQEARNLAGRAFECGDFDGVAEQMRDIIKNHQEFEVVGMVLHIHSLREVCGGCGYSIAQEFRHAWQKKFVLEHEEGSPPYANFFYVAISADQNIEGKDHDNRPPAACSVGASQQSVLTEDGLVDAALLMKQGVVVERLLADAQAAAGKA